MTTRPKAIGSTSAAVLAGETEGTGLAIDNGMLLVSAVGATLHCLRAPNACRRIKFRRGIGLTRLFEIEIESLATRCDFDSDFDCDTEDHDLSV
jgi:hypothetical protein